MRIIEKIFFLCLAGAAVPVCAGGKSAAAGQEPRSRDWVICVTAFDVSSFPPERRITGEIMTRQLLESLKLVEFRTRMEREYRYYEEYTAYKDQGEAAKKLAAKLNERDNLLFRGDPEWKYRNNLKTIEADIKKLGEELAKTAETVPLIDAGPAFKFADANNNDALPAPPNAGGEYRFCQAQRADAFLAGTVSEFYGRIYISVKMYTVYTRSFEYEDSIIFSTEDAASALEELAGRLVAAAAGSEPALVAIHAQPPEAVVTINGSFAGRGEISPREHPPGELEVDVFADEYETASLPLTIRSGELAELFIDLKPISQQALTVDTAGKPGSLVYRGALFAGEAPFAFTMPSNQYEYIRVETPEGETGAAVIAGSARGGSAPGPSAPPVFDLRTSMPPGPDEKPVDNSRKKFYGAYGRFWITLPAAFLLSGIYTSYSSAYERKPSEAMYGDTLGYYYLSTGAMALAGVALTETFYRLFRYLYTSNKNTAPPVLR
jgi:hypothetical protein